MRHLVIACPRSGTAWITQVMRRDRGLDVRHEHEGPDGIVSWCLAAPNWDRLPAWHGTVSRQFRDDFEAGRVQVVHQVREPLACIASMTTIGDESWRFIAEHVPIDPGWPVLRRALAMWVSWNALGDLIGLSIGATLQRVEDVVSSVPPRNQRAHGTVSWADLEGVDDYALSQAKLMAEEYGYPVTDPQPPRAA